MIDRVEQNWEQAIACAKTRWLQDLLRQHLPEMAHLEDTPSDHELARQWDAKMKALMAARGLTTPAQQKNRLVDIRNAISTLDPNHPALADVDFTTSQWEEINRASSDKVGDRSTQFLTCPDAIVNQAIELLDSREWNEVAAGLAVVTGRRCAEILKTANLSYQTPFSVTFAGALKRKSEPMALQFEIPTLAPADRVIKALAKLRSWIDTSQMDNREVNNRYAEGVIKACDRYFADLVPTRDGKDNLYTHLFRAVYATIATHWYCPPKVPTLEFRAYIQGHFQVLDAQDPTLRRSLAAQRNYFDYQIADGSGNVDGRLGIKLGQPGVEVLSAFRRYYQASPKSDRPQEPSKGLLDRVRETALKMLHSDRYQVVLTGLMAVTGRSAGELLKSKIFAPDPSDPFSLLFSSTVARNKQPMPTLIEADAVLEAIARLKQHPDVQPLLYLPPNQIDSHCLPQIEPMIRDSLPFTSIKEMMAAFPTLTNSQAIATPVTTSKKPSPVIYHVHPDDKEQLSAIAHQFHTSTQADTASVALKWATVAIELASRLGYDDPASLSAWAEQQFSAPPLPAGDVEGETRSTSPSESVRAASPQENREPRSPASLNEDLVRRVLEGFEQQQQSIAHLTQAIQSLVATSSSPSPAPVASAKRGQKTESAIPQPQPDSTSPVRRFSCGDASPSRAATPTRTPVAARSSSEAAEAKVNRYIDAIFDYNNKVATTKKEKWAVSISALKALTKCSQEVIERVLVARGEEIEAHHDLHELGQFQNSKGKFAHSISQVIHLD